MVEIGVLSGELSRQLLKLTSTDFYLFMVDPYERAGTDYYEQEPWYAEQRNVALPKSIF